MTDSTPDYLDIGTPQGPSGTLRRGVNDYYFSCRGGAPPASDISLTMPNRGEPYASRELHPIFQMNLPEGYVLEQLRQRFAKATTLDPMLLLALSGQASAIGRVQVSSPAIVPPGETRGERLAEILAWDGSEDLFAALAQRYLMRTAVSGAQPKLLVPEDSGKASAGKAAMVTPELIVKSAGTEFPGLAVNEFVCMSIARAAGLPVPEFYLSRNAQLFVMRRFDRTTTGAALGFEDMAVLMAKGANEKYSGSYESLARAIRLYCAPGRQHENLAQLFGQVALSCLLGNGDAHLKNFGVLYADPLAEVRLAPSYDIVNTTMYLAQDQLALLLGGSKSLAASPRNLEAFARHCLVDQPRQYIDRLLEASEQVLVQQQGLLGTVPLLAPALRHNLQRFQ